MMGDLLRGMDHGGYYFFRHKAQHYSELVPIMQAGNFLGSLVVVGVLMVLVVLVLLMQRGVWPAVGAGIVFVASVPLVEMLRSQVAGRRPEDAQNLLDAEELSRSFPAPSVFLFTIVGVILIIAVWPALRGSLVRAVVTAVVVVLILMVSVSQLFLGLHFVSDVMAGLAGGIALGLACGQVLRRAESRSDRGSPVVNAPSSA